MELAIRLDLLLLKSLVCKSFVYGVSPNGLNINHNCGSTNPNKIKKIVQKHKAHLGISLDGDADRIIISDSNGKIIDGDQIIASIAKNGEKRYLKMG